jgi:hypothetical protein
VQAKRTARREPDGGWAGGVIGGVTGTELQLLADGKAMDAIGSEQASAALVEFLLRAYVASPLQPTCELSETIVSDPSEIS